MPIYQAILPTTVGAFLAGAPMALSTAPTTPLSGPFLRPYTANPYKVTSFAGTPNKGIAGAVFNADGGNIVCDNLHIDKSQSSFTVEASFIWGGGAVGLLFGASADYDAFHAFRIVHTASGSTFLLRRYYTSNTVGGSSVLALTTGALGTADRLDLRAVYTKSGANNWTYEMFLKRTDSAGSLQFDYTSIFTGNLATDSFTLPVDEPLRVGVVVEAAASVLPALTAFSVTGDATVVPPATTFNIVNIGDSNNIQRSSNGLKPIGGRVADLVATARGVAARAFYAGISSTTTASWAQRTAGSNFFSPDYLDSILAAKTALGGDVVVYTPGINDCIDGSFNAATSKTNATTTLNAFPDTPIVLVTPAKVAAGYASAATVNANVDALHTKYAEIVATINAATPGRATHKDGRVITASGSTDGLHYATDTAQAQQMAALIAEGIAEVVPLADTEDDDSMTIDSSNDFPVTIAWTEVTAAAAKTFRFGFHGEGQKLWWKVAASEPSAGAVGDVAKSDQPQFADTVGSGKKLYVRTDNPFTVVVHVSA